jgi:tRNA(Ile)-lysidine synthase
MRCGDFTGKITNLIDRTGPYENAPLVAVAVSGGGDSMAMALLAENWAKGRGGRVIALTVDHRLRTGSTEEARKVSVWLKARHIEHHTLTWRDPQGGSALQANARAARYKLMEQWCRDRGVLHLLLAHNAEDQAETFLMRLDKGSGPDGLSAMSAVSEQRFCRFVRPLLSVSRTELRSYLSAIGQDWLEDPSNLDDRFERIRWRRIMTEEKLSTDGFCQAALRYGRARAVLDLEAARASARFVGVHPAGFIRINRQIFEASPLETNLRVVARALMAVGGNGYSPRRKKLERLMHIVCQNSHETCTLAGCRLESSGTELLITRENRHLPLPVSLPADVDYLLWDNRFRLSVKMSVHDKANNICIRPLGAKGDAEIRAFWERAGRQTIPRSARLVLPALADKTGVLSVPWLEYSRMKGDDAGNQQNTRFSGAVFRSLNSLSGSGYFVAN